MLKNLVYLMRHGQTEWNAMRRALGSTDLPLNNRGKEQSKETAEFLKNCGIKRIISSPLKRAVQTAEIVNSSLPKPLKILTDPRLKEFSLGRWEGMSSEQLKKDPLFKKYKNNPTSVPFPSGQKLTDVYKDCWEAFEKYSSQKLPCLIVTHSGIIKLIISKLLKMPLEYFWIFQIGNASVSMVDMEENPPRVVCVNFMPKGNYLEVKF